MDFCKVFDTVPYTILLSPLGPLKIPSNPHYSMIFKYWVVAKALDQHCLFRDNMQVKRETEQRQKAWKFPT